MKVFNCIMGVFALIAAFYCFFMPGASALMTFGWIVTVLLAVIGICGIFEYVKTKKEKKQMAKSVLSLILAIGAAVLSVIGLFNIRMRAMFDIVVILLFAFWLVVNGIDSVAESIKNKKSGHKSWWFQLLMGILLVLIGLYAGTHLIYATITLGYLMGISLTLYGIRLIGSVADD